MQTSTFEVLQIFFSYILNYFSTFFQCFPCMEISLIFCLCFYLLCRCGNNHFDVHFRRLGPVHFLVEKWKRRGAWRTKWTEVCLFAAIIGIYPLINNMTKVLFPICTLIWRVNFYVSRQGMVWIGEIKVQLWLYKLQLFSIVPFFYTKHFDCLYSLKLLSLTLGGDNYW